MLICVGLGAFGVQGEDCGVRAPRLWAAEFSDLRTSS